MADTNAGFFFLGRPRTQVRPIFSPISATKVSVPNGRPEFPSSSKTLDQFSTILINELVIAFAGFS